MSLIDLQINNRIAVLNEHLSRPESKRNTDAIVWLKSEIKQLKALKKA